MTKLNKSYCDKFKKYKCDNLKTQIVMKQIVTAKKLEGELCYVRL